MASRIFPCLLILVSAIASIRSVSGYSFHWSGDGYKPYSGGGTYDNIDHSGISMNVSGLFNDFTNVVVPNSVITGINNGAEQGIVHNYIFTFSKRVDLSFRIIDITVSHASFKYDDELLFSGRPAFTDISAVTIDHYRVYPVEFSIDWGGVITVTYHNISQFSIRHGNGDINPGYIGLGDFTFTEALNLPVFLPNAFTPNRDGLNDAFVLANPPLYTETFSCIIYNRWGQIAYITDDPSVNWEGSQNGNECPEGTYLVVIAYIDTDERPQQLRSFITLIR